MSQMANLFRVASGTDLQKLLQENKQRITVIFYSDDRVPGCQMNKPLFVKASKTFTDCMFVFLDLRKYEDQEAGFTKNLNGSLPKYVFYYDFEQIAYVDGPHFDKFVDTLNYLLSQLERIRRQQQEPTPTPSPVPVSSSVPEGGMIDPSEGDSPSLPSGSPSLPSGSPHTPGNSPTARSPAPEIPTPISGEQLEQLKKMHSVQKQKMMRELAQLNYLKNQQQRMLLSQMQMLENMKKNKEKQIHQATLDD